MSVKLIDLIPVFWGNFSWCNVQQYARFSEIPVTCAAQMFYVGPLPKYESTVFRANHCLGNKLFILHLFQSMKVFISKLTVVWYGAVL